MNAHVKSALVGWSVLAVFAAILAFIVALPAAAAVVGLLVLGFVVGQGLTHECDPEDEYCCF